MNRERLTTLAKFLENVPVEKFDISVWSEEREGCGTVACAAGWACTIPEFREAGLRLVLDEDGDWIPIYGESNDPDECNAGYDALMEFFDLRNNEEYFLFEPDQYKIISSIVTPRDVANRIYGLLGAAA